MFKIRALSEMYGIWANEGILVVRQNRHPVAPLPSRRRQ
jgi:hypothetical protein